MYLVFTRMPGKSYRRRLGSFLYLFYVFRARFISLVCGFGNAPLIYIFRLFGISSISSL